MDDICRLRSAMGDSPYPCDKGSCMFWRVVDHLGVETAEGCAIQHYELLGDHDLASWLLSVKERIERDPIGFRATPAEETCSGS